MTQSEESAPPLTSWSEREDWLRDHGMSPYDDREILLRDGGSVSVYVCDECGALVLHRHQHADFHAALTGSSTEGGT